MSLGESRLRVVSLLPDLLGTYGDGGNARILERRLAWRGIPCELVTVRVGTPVPAGGDLYVLGGGEDEAQLAALVMLRTSAFVAAVERGAHVLAVCAGLQLLGRSLMGPDGQCHEGLGIIDARTDRLKKRAVGEVVARLPGEPDLGLLTGFENHAGRTQLGPGLQPLSRVLKGTGNGSVPRVDGARTHRVLATYLHGPVLARNPQLADLALERVLGTALAPLHHDAHDQLRRQLLKGRAP